MAYASGTRLRASRVSRAAPAGRRNIPTVCKAHKVAVLPGDGIGPEIMAAALKVLTVAGQKEGETFEFKEALIGGAAIDATGNPLPKETLDLCKASDAVLLAAIGGCARRAARLARPLVPRLGHVTLHGVMLSLAKQQRHPPKRPRAGRPKRPPARVAQPPAPAPTTAPACMSPGPGPALPQTPPPRSYKWDTLPADQRPERGLLGLRAGLNAFANLRPAIVPKQVCGAYVMGRHSLPLHCIADAPEHQLLRRGPPQLA